jgi:molecular chaperone HscA
LKKHNSLILPQESNSTEQAIYNLQQAILQSDKNIIQQLTEALNTISTPYAERIMNTAVAKSLQGKNI